MASAQAHRFASVDHLSAEAVAAYVDNELTPRALHRAKSHLLKCQECREEIKAHLAASRRLREAAAANSVCTPADLKARLTSIPVECAHELLDDDETTSGRGYQRSSPRNSSSRPSLPPRGRRRGGKESHD